MNDLFPETTSIRQDTAAQSFPVQLRAVRDAGEDFEWYPTTDEIIRAFTRSLAAERDTCRQHYRNNPHHDILDIGAGNGKVLDAVRKLSAPARLFAIEKSRTLINLLPPDVFILGVDFWQTSLIDKPVDVIFSNPPYSRFAEWTGKILAEARPGALIYLVIPERWEKSADLKRQLGEREAGHKIVGTFDFEDAEDRRARARVHLVRIRISEAARKAEDPFTRFFDETFHYPEPEREGKTMEEEIRETRIVHRVNLIEALCLLHDARMVQLQENYAAICRLPLDILREFEIGKPGLLKSLRMKLAETKREYWRRLFDGMVEINSRLTRESRRTMATLMQDQTGIDFNRDNAYAIVLWVVKNANQYFDQQLVATHEAMVEFANIEGYRSNRRIFGTHGFRYDFVRDKTNVNYRLKVGHRMVLSHCGGIENNWKGTGLCERAAGFLGDLITVAANLGFRVIDPAPQDHAWKDSGAHVFRFANAEGKPEALFRVRAFRNQNMHIQFHPDFIHALNVQHGRLKGWLRDESHAAAELEIPLPVAARHFAAGFRLTGDALRLMAPAA